MLQGSGKWLIANGESITVGYYRLVDVRMLSLFNSLQHIALPCHSAEPQRSGGDEESLTSKPFVAFSGTFRACVPGIPHFVRNDNAARVFVKLRSHNASFFLVIPRNLSTAIFLVIPQSRSAVPYSCHPEDAERSGGDEGSLMSQPHAACSGIYHILFGSWKLHQHLQSHPEFALSLPKWRLESNLRRQVSQSLPRLPVAGFCGCDILLK
jgi:hypothetical protein